MTDDLDWRQRGACVNHSHVPWSWWHPEGNGMWREHAEYRAVGGEA